MIEFIHLKKHDKGKVVVKKNRYIAGMCPWPAYFTLQGAPGSQKFGMYVITKFLH